MDFLQKIKEAYTGGKINSYMAERLAKIAEFGMTEQLLSDALEDAEGASLAGVENDKDYNVRFFILNFADDILDDTFGMNIIPEDKPNLCQYAVRLSKDKDYTCDNLTDYRLLLHKWLNDKHNKKAHPNTQGKFDKDIAYDTVKWTNTAKAIYSLLKDKRMDHDKALNFATLSWDADEKFKFSRWLNYYDSGK